MTPDQLLTFAIVADEANISRAADRLHLSQPAVSGQLRLLQESFGQPLYRRVGRGIVLTSAGERLASIARQLQQTYDRAQQLQAALAGLQTGSLMLGASTTPASYVLPHLLASFRTRHARVDCHLVTGNTSDICGQLARFDLAFIEGPIPAGLPAHVRIEPWHQDEIVAIVPPGHALADRPADTATGWPALTLDELAPWPLLLRESGSGVRQQVLRALAEAKVEPLESIELAGVEGIKEGVRAGLGVGFVSAMSMQRQDPTLRALRITRPRSLERHLTILLPHADDLSPPAQAFLDLCLDGPAYNAPFASSPP
ncbi:MAG: LysR family transcriptional regulator [Pigmentiphaga sp.]|nr:LysR family transcriptional regulator [Pigmentiphaga sp.]